MINFRNKSLTPHRPSGNRLSALEFARASALFLVILQIAVNAMATVEDRLDDSRFREGLRQRQLFDVLKLHLKENPGKDPIAAAENRLELEYMAADDIKSPAEQRAAATASVVEILESLIAENPDHPNRFRWSLDLAKAVIHRLAEKLIIGIEFESPRLAADAHEQLQALTVKAEPFLRDAEFQIGDYLMEMRQDANFNAEYVNTGIHDKTVELQRMIRFYLPIIEYYRALSLPDGEDCRRLLNDAVEHLDPWVQGKPQEGVLYDAHLLTGKCHRLLGDYDQALRSLNQADVDEAPDAVRYKSKFERIRVQRDAGDLDGAIDTAEQMEKWVPDEIRSPGSELAIILQKRKIYLQQDRADLANQIIVDFLHAYPDAKGDVYATLASGIDEKAEPDSLSALELAAKGAVLLGDGRIEEAHRFLNAIVARDTFEAQTLKPEALFNMAVGLHKHDALAAANLFMQLVTDFPESQNALQAAEFAVRLTNEARKIGGKTERYNLAFRQALETLIKTFPDSDNAKNWQFWYAHLLYELREFEFAIAAFSLVALDDPFYPDSQYLLVDSNKLLFEGELEEQPEVVIRNSPALVEKMIEVSRLLRNAATDAQDPGLVQRYRSYAARCTLNAAEILLNILDDAPKALDRVKGFQEVWSEQRELIGEALRLRIKAYQMLKQNAEANAALEAFVQDHSEEAGPVIVAVLKSIRGEVDAAKRGGQDDQARRLALEAVNTANWLVQWCAGNDLKFLSFAEKQLASALLDAGKLDEAQAVYDRLLQQLEDDPDIVMGLGRIALERDEFKEARSHFNKLIEGLPERTPHWWEGWLWSLKTSLELGADKNKLRLTILQLESRFDASTPKWVKNELQTMKIKFRRNVH